MSLTIFILWTFFSLCTSKEVKGIFEYEDYLKQWKYIVPEKYVKDVSGLSTKQQKCGDKQCQYFYYLYENQAASLNPYQNRTVLLISGVKGNQYTGPNLLLNLYGQINSSRVIYFPVANPSGFYHRVELSSPNNINIEEKTPYDTQNCQQTSTFKILAYLYKLYRIDLTIYVNDNDPSLVFSSLDKNHQQNSKSAQIYTDFQTYFAHQGKEIKVEFNIENKPIFLLDWLYSLGKYPLNSESKCLNRYNDDFSHSKNSIALAIGLGRLDSNNKESVQSRQFIEKRSILLNNIVRFASPSITVQSLSLKSIAIIVKGCINTKITNLTIWESPVKPIFKQEDITLTSKIFGNIVLQLKSLAQDLKKGLITIDYECDANWKGLGYTFLANSTPATSFYKFAYDQNSKVFVVQQITSGQFDDRTLYQKISDLPFYDQIIVWGLAFLVVSWGFNCLWSCLQVRKSMRRPNFKQKFQQVEYVENLDSYDIEASHSEAETNEDKMTLNHK